MERKRPGRRPDRQPPSAAGSEKRSLFSGKQGLIFAVIVLVAVGITIGINYYFTEVAPLQQPVIKVNGEAISVDYFLRRVRFGGMEGNLFGAIQSLTEEEIIRQRAPQIVGEVTEADIDEALRRMARGENESISDVEFENWYRGQVNESKLTEAEYREMVGTAVLAQRLQEHLAERTPTVAPQIHLHQIVIDDYEAALEVVAELEEGADFAQAAREHSVGPSAAENGGDLGWLPEEALPDDIDWVFYLEPGVPSQPYAPDRQSARFLIFMVSEKAEARELTGDMLEVVKASALKLWLENEVQMQEITFHGRDGENRDNFGSETEAWLRYQLSRM